MSARLPPGCIVQLNRFTRVTDDGAALIGGSPTRVLRLTPAARGLLQHGRLTVTSPAASALAALLIDRGMAEPVAASLPEAELSSITVVIPVRDRPGQLARLLRSLGGRMPVIVVDDASPDPGTTERAAAAAGAALIRLPRNLGPAGARNAGLAAVTTPFAAFLDSDIVAVPEAIELALRHFADPAVALVAPRVRALAQSRPNWVTRYEHVRSSLDLGPDPATVRPGSRVAWTSSACLLARVTAIGEGFDARMRAGEDVDLVWRTVAAGHRVQYEPAAVVLHEHRRSVRAWLGRKAFYGTSAPALAQRHPEAIAPAVLTWSSAAWLLAILAQRRWSLPVAAGIAAITAVRLSRRLGQLRHPGLEAARLTAQGLGGQARQASGLLLRHWWPLTALGCLLSRRLRRAVLASAMVDTALEYARHRPSLDPVRFGLALRLDDLAYGAGVWWASLRACSVRALLPRRHRDRR